MVELLEVTPLSLFLFHCEQAGMYVEQAGMYVSRGERFQEENVGLELGIVERNHSRY